MKIVMKTFADIVKLCQGEQGKVFIMDEAGDLKLVVMSGAEYERSKRASAGEIDPELVNAKIAEAKMADGVTAQGANPYPESKPPRVAVNPPRDLREEVIDPSFDFDAPDDL